MSLEKILAALKSTGKSAGQLGKSVYGAGKEFSMANPKTASAIGGGSGALLLSKLLSGKSKPEEDADEQKRLLSQMYGM